MNIKLIIIGLSIALVSACHQKGKDESQKLTDFVRMENQEALVDTTVFRKENDSLESQADQAEVWLKSIFKTKNSDKYFPAYNVEEKLCTKRFQQFITESAELYGPSNLTDEKYPEAEKTYREKWSKTYPIEEREMWLFGRGNGDIDELKQLEISKLNDNVYRVVIDYGNDMKTENEVTVVSDNGSFKIDYCKTKFID